MYEPRRSSESFDNIGELLNKNPNLNSRAKCAPHTGRSNLFYACPTISPKFSFPKLIFDIISLASSVLIKAPNRLPITSCHTSRIVTGLYLLCTKALNGNLLSRVYFGHQACRQIDGNLFGLLHSPIPLWPSRSVPLSDFLRRLITYKHRNIKLLAMGLAANGRGGKDG